jgi:hypothetical protein
MSYTNPATNNVFSYKSCYADLVNWVRALPNGLTNSAGTVEGAFPPLFLPSSFLSY